MSSRKASIKETGEELSQEEWARFDDAVAKVQSERVRSDRPGIEWRTGERRSDLVEVSETSRTERPLRR